MKKISKINSYVKYVCTYVSNWRRFVCSNDSENRFGVSADQTHASRTDTNVNRILQIVIWIWLVTGVRLIISRVRVTAARAYRVDGGTRSAARVPGSCGGKRRMKISRETGNGICFFPIFFPALFWLIARNVWSWCAYTVLRFLYTTVWQTFSECSWQGKGKK